MSKNSQSTKDEGMSKRSQSKEDEVLAYSEALMERGDQYIENGWLLEAVGYFYQAAMYLSSEQNFHAQQSKAWTNAAECHLRLMNWKAAEEACTNALNTQPGNLTALCVRAKARFKLKDYEGAANDAEQANTEEAQEVAKLCRTLDVVQDTQKTDYRVKWNRRVIDSYRLRVDEEYAATGIAEYGSLYYIRSTGQNCSPIGHFRAYLKKGIKKGVLPSWFKMEDVETICALAVTDKIYNINTEANMAEILHHYEMLGMPMEFKVLRELAEHIEGPIPSHFDDIYNPQKPQTLNRGNNDLIIRRITSPAVVPTLDPGRIEEKRQNVDIASGTAKAIEADQRDDVQDEKDSDVADAMDAGSSNRSREGREGREGIAREDLQRPTNQSSEGQSVSSRSARERIDTFKSSELKGHHSRDSPSQEEATQAVSVHDLKQKTKHSSTKTVVNAVCSSGIISQGSPCRGRPSSVSSKHSTGGASERSKKSHTQSDHASHNEAPSPHQDSNDRVVSITESISKILRVSIDPPYQSNSEECKMEGISDVEVNIVKGGHACDGTSKEIRMTDGENRSRKGETSLTRPYGKDVEGREPDDTDRVLSSNRTPREVNSERYRPSSEYMPTVLTDPRSSPKDSRTSMTPQLDKNLVKVERFRGFQDEKVVAQGAIVEQTVASDPVDDVRQAVLTSTEATTKLLVKLVESLEKKTQELTNPMIMPSYANITSCGTSALDRPRAASNQVSVERSKNPLMQDLHHVSQQF